MSVEGEGKDADAALDAPTLCAGKSFANNELAVESVDDVNTAFTE